MSARRHRRHHSACRRRPRPDELAGVDDHLVRARTDLDVVEVLRVVTLSNVKATAMPSPPVGKSG